MASTGLSTQSEFTYHFAAVRLHVEGSGQLQMKLISLSDVKEAVMVPLTMQNPTPNLSTKLVNFKQARARLEIKTTEIDEVFDVNAILIFTKPVSSSDPL